MHQGWQVRPMDGGNSGEWLILLFNPVAGAFWNMP